MALDLNEYIKMSYKRPNRKVLEGLGASEDLIKYLMETPWNTNWNVIGSIGESGEDIGEVWFTGFGSVGDDTVPLGSDSTFEQREEIYTNGENYQIFLNKKKLPSVIRTSNTITWSDGQDTVKIEYNNNFEEYFIDAFFHTPLTGPTTVEVSVKEITK